MDWLPTSSNLAASLTAQGITSTSHPPHPATNTGTNTGTTPPAAHVACAAAVVHVVLAMGSDVLRVESEAVGLIRMLMQLHMDPAMRGWSPSCMQAVGCVLDAMGEAAWNDCFTVGGDMWLMGCCWPCLGSRRVLLVWCRNIKTPRSAMCV